LRGDLHGARRTLLRLARRTRSVPSLEGRRAVSLGFSYLLEERHDRALAWARKAREAYRRRGDAAVDILVPIVEIAALMGLDQIDRASEVAARETRSSRDDRGLAEGTAILFRAGILFRRGEMKEARRGVSARKRPSAAGGRSLAPGGLRWRGSRRGRSMRSTRRPRPADSGQRTRMRGCAPRNVLWSAETWRKPKPPLRAQNPGTAA